MFYLLSNIDIDQKYSKMHNTHHEMIESMNPNSHFYYSEQWNPKDVIIKDQQKLYSLTLGAKEFNNKINQTAKDINRVNIQNYVDE